MRSNVFLLSWVLFILTVFVGPFHHGMARRQVADGRTASDMEGSCEYIE